MPVCDQRLMDLNYHGSVRLTRAVVPSLMRQQQGRVVLVSSMAGQIGVFGYSAYSPSKFALRGLAEVLQMEVRSVCVCVCLCVCGCVGVCMHACVYMCDVRERDRERERGDLFFP